MDGVRAQPQIRQVDAALLQPLAPDLREPAGRELSGSAMTELGSRVIMGLRG